MRYAIAIEPGDAEHAYGVTAPDLPGCFSAGESRSAYIARRALAA